jgi:Spy/CpxP family protein refolding chaperone
MKRLMLASFSLVFGLAALPALAQQSASGTTAPAAAEHGQRMDPQEQLARLSKRLQLTADQQSKIGAILTQRQQQVQAVRGDSTLKPADKRAKLLALMQTTQQSVNAVLTDEQRQRWTDMREKMMQRRDAKKSGQSSSSDSQ